MRRRKLIFDIFHTYLKLGIDFYISSGFCVLCAFSCQLGDAFLGAAAFFHAEVACIHTGKGLLDCDPI